MSYVSGHLAARIEALNNDEQIKASAARLLELLFKNDREAGSLGIGDKEWIVYIQCRKKHWRGPTPSDWEGWPVRFRYNVGPPIAFCSRGVHG